MKGEANVLTSESNVGFNMSLPQETAEPSAKWAVKADRVEKICIALTPSSCFLFNICLVSSEAVPP